MHGEGVMATFDDVFTEIEDDVEVLKGIASKDDDIATNSCEYSGVELVEGDVRLNFR